MNRFVPFILFLVCFDVLFGETPEKKSVTIQQELSSPLEEPSITQPKTVTLLFAGDSHFEWGIKQLQKKEGFDSPIEMMEPLFRSADFRILNLETPVSASPDPLPGKAYVFAAEKSQIRLLKRLNIDLAIIGNNHIMDFGSAGLRDTQSLLLDQMIATAGAGDDRENALSPFRFTLNGIQFALLSFTNTGPKEQYSTGKNAGVVSISDSTLNQIKALKREVDHIIVSIHWGNEYSMSPDEEQRSLARKIIRYGATAVIGHHPHVPQGIEQTGGGVIVYSLGNFLFGSKHTYQSDNMVVKIHFDVQSKKLNAIQVYPINGIYSKYGHKPAVIKEQRARDFWKFFYVQYRELNPSIKRPMEIQDDGSVLLPIEQD